MSIVERIAELEHRGEPCAIATVIRSEGPVPMQRNGTGERMNHKP